MHQKPPRTKQFILFCPTCDLRCVLSKLCLLAVMDISNQSQSNLILLVHSKLGHSPRQISLSSQHKDDSLAVESYDEQEEWTSESATTDKEDCGSLCIGHKQPIRQFNSRSNLTPMVQQSRTSARTSSSEDVSSSPRTIRLNMLRKELPTEFRRALLWERKENAGQKRKDTTIDVLELAKPSN